MAEVVGSIPTGSTMSVKVKFKKTIRYSGTSFSKVSTYGTGEVFLGLGWSGETKALTCITPAKARDLGKALIQASKKAKWKRG